MRVLRPNLKPGGTKPSARTGSLLGRAALGILVAIAAWIGASQVQATSPWVDLGQIRVRLIEGPVRPADSGLVGLDMRLAPGWATYWRDPGAVGVAPSFDWRGSANLAEALVLWPAPQRVQEGNTETFGYTEQVVLPIEIRPERPDAPVALRLKLVFAVCGRICVPKHADLSLNLATNPQSEADVALLSPFLDRVPRPNRPDLKVARISLTERALTVVLAAEPPVPRGARLDLIADGPDGVLPQRPEARLHRDGRQAVLTLRPNSNEVLPERLELTLVAGERTLSAVAGRKGAD